MNPRALIAVVLLAAFTNCAMADFKLIEGSAAYRERIALHPDAVLEVELRDVSRADPPAPLLSAISIRPDRQVPIPFRMLYDDRMIDQRHSYAVSAKIRVGERIVFRSTSMHPVLTRGSPEQIEVMMERMPAASAPQGIFGVTWTAENIGGRGVVDRAQSTITFANDGTASGSGGCNAFSGRAKVDGARIEIGPLAATQRACAPPLDDQEQKFFEALAAARTFEIDERTKKLILKNENGAELARFDPGAGRRL